MIERMIEALIAEAPPIMTRQKVSELTGGLISEKTLANRDSEGRGIVPRCRFGRKVAYPREAVVDFLQQNWVVQ